MSAHLHANTPDNQTPQFSPRDLESEVKRGIEAGRKYARLSTERKESLLDRIFDFALNPEKYEKTITDERAKEKAEEERCPDCKGKGNLWAGGVGLDVLCGTCKGRGAVKLGTTEKRKKARKIEYSREILFHFKCGTCGHCWTIGDFVPESRGWLTCPHCSTGAVVEQAKELWSPPPVLKK